MHLAGQTPDALILHVDMKPNTCWSGTGSIGVTKGSDTARDMNINLMQWSTTSAGTPSHFHYVTNMNFSDTGIVRVNIGGYIIDVIAAGAGMNINVGILLIGWITGAVWSVP